MSRTPREPDQGGYFADDEFASPLQSPLNFDEIYAEQNSNQATPPPSAARFPSSTIDTLNGVTFVLDNTKHQAYRNHPSSDSENATLFSSVTSWPSASASQSTFAQMSPHNGPLPRSSGALKAMSAAAEVPITDGVNALDLAPGRPATPMSFGKARFAENTEEGSGGQYAPDIHMQDMDVYPLDPPAQIHEPVRDNLSQPHHMQQDADADRTQLLEGAVASTEDLSVLYASIMAYHARDEAELAIENLIQTDAEDPDAGPGDNEGGMAGSGDAGDARLGLDVAVVGMEGLGRSEGIGQQVEAGEGATYAGVCIDPALIHDSGSSASAIAPRPGIPQHQAKRKMNTMSWASAEMGMRSIGDMVSQSAERAAQAVRPKQGKQAKVVVIEWTPKDVDMLRSMSETYIPEKQVNPTNRTQNLAFDKTKWETITSPDNMEKHFSGRTDFAVKKKATDLGLKISTTNPKRVGESVLKRLAKAFAKPAPLQRPSGGGGTGN